MSVLAHHVGPGTRVLLVSGSYGLGHDAAAAELRGRFEALGARVETVDVVDHFPLGLGRLLRTLYFLQLRVAPRTWGGLLDRLRPGSRLHRAAQALLRTASPRLVAAAHGHDLVVATHPFAGQALGPARLDGRLRTPVVTYLTDPSVHALWVHPGVDRHVGLLEVAVRQARALGGRAELDTTDGLALAPRCPTSYDDGSVRDVAEVVLARAGLPTTGPVALVVGGSEGVGDLAASARDLAATGLVTPVVLCGRNRRLRARLERQGLCALGWRDDVPALMRASAVVVQNAGGFSCREARAVGTPVLSYRCLPGHGRANAAALEEAGLASWVRGPEDLGPALLAVLAVAVQPAVA